MIATFSKYHWSNCRCYDYRNSVNFERWPRPDGDTVGKDFQAMTTVKANLKRIANFELQELIGSGGMANIYKGVQLSLERPVAIKVLHQHLTLNEDFVTRFKQEAKQAAILQHQNIVSIIDYGHQDAEYFIAMEYIDGQNLKDILSRIKRFPLEVALLIAREVASGLKYAHIQGLIHRDIKPANIMLSKDGRVVITDFGIAKTYGDMSITVTGQTIGSPAYMSPEQAAGRPIDHRCDIFSLGIVLYEIVTGEKPFKGDNYQEAMTNVISGTPADPSSLRVDVNLAIESIMKKALQKDSESRYQDAEEMAAQIDTELEHYVLPSEKKVIAGFVRNPIRTTEKLRSDRISKHMESALYYVNIGHGRLTDAINEFENVLRYDKNNKIAKQYLDKLKSGRKDFVGSPPPRKFKLSFWGMAIITAVSIAAMILFVLAFKYDSLSLGGLFKSGEKGAAANQPRHESNSQSKVADSKPADMSRSVAPAVETSNKDGKSKKDVVSSKGDTSKKVTKPQQSARQPVASAETNKDMPNGPASNIVSEYNYPNQNLKEFGLAKIIAKPPSEFSVDFKYYGKTGGPDVKLTPGRHIISIDAKGYRAERKRIFTEEGKSQIIEVELKPEL